MLHGKSANTVKNSDIALPLMNLQFGCENRGTWRDFARDMHSSQHAKVSLMNFLFKSFQTLPTQECCHGSCHVGLSSGRLYIYPCQCNSSSTLEGMDKKTA
jgi:hypothetical protein